MSKKLQIKSDKHFKEKKESIKEEKGDDFKAKQIGAHPGLGS